MAVLPATLPASRTTSTPIAPRLAPDAPVNSRPTWPALVVGLVVAAVADVYIGVAHGGVQAALFALGLGLGVALFHSRFGFTSAWRQLVGVGQGKGLRAHTVLLGTTATLFALVLATGASFSGITPTPSVSAIGIGSLFGALLFGLGMQLGGACASGTLFAVGSGQTSIVLTLGGFVFGSVLGTWHYDFWQNTLPTFGSYGLADHIGYAGALFVTLAVLAAIAFGSLLMQKRRNPPPVAAVPTSRGMSRIVRGSWPLWVGAVLLAVLNALILMTGGHAWGVTGAFALWGAKIAQAVGLHPETWAYWQAPAQAASLHSAVLTNTTTLTDLGIIVGALVASAVAGQFMIHRRIPWRIAVGAVLGGILMGVGARLAHGCNIGAYLAGIASFSLSGWTWGVMALMGTWLGIRSRSLFGLPTPKATDSVC